MDIQSQPDNHDITDGEIIKLCRAGKKQEAHALFHKRYEFEYLRALRRYVVKRGFFLSITDYDDVMQKVDELTWNTVFERIPTFQQTYEDSLLRFAKVVAQKHTRNVVKKIYTDMKRFDNDTSLSDFDEFIEDKLSNPVSHFLQNPEDIFIEKEDVHLMEELKFVLARAMDLVQDDEQQLLFLFYEKLNKKAKTGLNATEVGEVLSIKPTAARQRKKRALKNASDAMLTVADALFTDGKISKATLDLICRFKHLRQKAVLDRFEAQMAVFILDETDAPLSCPLSKLPPDISEGDYVLLSIKDGNIQEIAYDKDTTEAARKRIQDKLERQRRDDNLNNMQF